ncbi:MAG: iron transporter [Ignavibacteria bacterium GWA2_55_11]|nr:MAG: iron transporter [Ignavibacteria bacterium GWA2_55_11]OGU43335.1 MAG: iron transporter [Ignavibacteria bacterium GWC2_56_12]OGU63173.1 MAG: iron transporter [Ignavibacteria bacterium RIFCSPHIGHO2_02_FULL_56_12]OGU70606.1 MAG: iron transporter [Ignavibacteria bacterium RIFCSPLOWO2_12_FULL_56_21]OGU73031.1 MAG: iron transporter [Ignavibacteria bacterium RIFCSPLOWO2_02_FULL_55_14]
MPLHKVRKGRRVLVVRVPEGKTRAQLIRLGILKGEFLKCLQRLPGGTMLVEKNRQEIAIGASLAGAILVTDATEVL